ncbi:hypothetical protein F5Y00DRAFT_260573 [Daldinia vernicosa]|uniref:uncharacterized protein n=1 Tax=Daldinia vernicosa TaxID=114800 RepID=UPI002007A708|nr:uncharacterized protein F5Y00DRAFT_260573 [Daldinia vernicosa]KAI0850275.1 hypothetical protein F5Y00DRAFT_260573 [Daldinia vernicosa]
MSSNNQARYIAQMEELYRNPLHPTSVPSYNYHTSTYPHIGMPQTMSTSVGTTMLPISGTGTHGAPQVQMEQMMSSNSGTYQGLIRDFVHFRQVNDQYLKIHNRPRGDCSDFPLDPQEQQQLVKLLFEAAHDCSETYEPEGSQSVRRISQGSYTDVEFELVLWPLLFSTRDAQMGQCRLPNYLYCREPPYNSYGSFMERFTAVCDALRLSKDVVVSLFKDATFKHRLGWRPRTELNQKATNRKLNGERDVQNAIGIRVAQENGIKANKSGELVDKNGQVYGNVKKRSTTFEHRITRTRKRGRDPKQEKASESLHAPNEEPKTGNNINEVIGNDGGAGSGMHLDFNPCGYTENPSGESQETLTGYAPSTPNNTNNLMQPTPPPTTNIYGQGPNPLVGSNMSFQPSCQSNGNASSAYASYEWFSNLPQAADHTDAAMDSNFDLGLLQTGNGNGEQYSQYQDVAPLPHFNPTVSAPFGNQLDQTVAQEQSDFLDFVPYADPLLQGQYCPPSTSTYRGTF